MVMRVEVLVGRVRSVEALETVDGVPAETLETTEETVVRSTVARGESVNTLAGTLCEKKGGEREREETGTMGGALTLVLQRVQPWLGCQPVVEVGIV